MSMEKRNSHGQASLFDGLTFLTLSMFSVAFIFTALSTYGSSENSLMDKSHITNYIQASFKSIYYIDASTLSIIPDEAGMKCSDLKDWNAITVAEILKRDLRDFNGSVYNTGLDDKYGPADAPGKLAARCAFREIFRPFTSAGYTYFVDFRFTGGDSISTRVLGTMPEMSIYQAGDKITNDQKITTCQQDVDPQKLVVSTPFQVFKCINDPLNGNARTCGLDEFIMTACLWPTQNFTT